MPKQWQHFFRVIKHVRWTTIEHFDKNMWKYDNENFFLSFKNKVIVITMPTY